MRSFDIAVIGGGINGVGIARDAAGRGLSVFLAEKGDFAEGTSSRATKLIHGGLRYLELYEFRLVRESLAERERVMKIAPHIVWPLRFILPHAPHLRPGWMIRAGLFLYDHLSRRQTLPGSRSLRLKDGPLKPEFARAFAYSDCWVDDARLVVLNARDAEARGAEVRRDCAVVSGARRDGAWELEFSDGTRIAARAVVNAAGPWVEQVLRERLSRPSKAKVRLVKGSHIVVPRLYDGPDAYILQNPDRRIVFAIPYEGDFTLIGTTDEAYEGDPAAVSCSPAETEYLCAALSHYFKKVPQPSDVIWSYSGVRPLYDDGSDQARTVTRDYVFELDTDGPPLLSIFGGKLTTYRELAERALDRLQPLMGFSPQRWTDSAPLPGGDGGPGFAEAFAREYPFLPPALAARLARLYGTGAREIIGAATGIEGLGRDLGHGLTEAEIGYLRFREWAKSAEDILWRRTKLGLRFTAAQAKNLEDYLRIPA